MDSRNRGIGTDRGSGRGRGRGCVSGGGGVVERRLLMPMIGMRRLRRLRHRVWRRLLIIRLRRLAHSEILQFRHVMGICRIIQWHTHAHGERVRVPSLLLLLLLLWLRVRRLRLGLILLRRDDERGGGGDGAKVRVRAQVQGGRLRLGLRLRRVGIVSSGMIMVGRVMGVRVGVGGGRVELGVVELGICVLMREKEGGTGVNFGWITKRSWGMERLRWEKGREGEKERTE